MTNILRQCWVFLSLASAVSAQLFSYTFPMSSVAPLLVYDGDCAFCSSLLRRLQAILRYFPDATPWQFADLTQLGLSRADVTKYVWFLHGNKRPRGHAAFASILQLQDSQILRFFGFLIVTPPFSWFFRLGYWLLARFRHRLPGGTPECAMPRN